MKLIWNNGVGQVGLVRLVRAGMAGMFWWKGLEANQFPRA